MRYWFPCLNTKLSERTRLTKVSTHTMYNAFRLQLTATCRGYKSRSRKPGGLWKRQNCNPISKQKQSIKAFLLIHYARSLISYPVLLCLVVAIGLFVTLMPCLIYFNRAFSFVLSCGSMVWKVWDVACIWLWLCSPLYLPGSDRWGEIGMNLEGGFAFWIGFEIWIWV